LRQGRGSSLLRSLLAEHHVYVRNGQTSRYVVLRWPWRAGVILALVVVAGWIGLASLGWLAAHLETLDQRRELARLAEAYQQLEALATGHAGEPARLTPITSLVAELEEVKGGRERGFSLSEPDASLSELDASLSELDPAHAAELRQGPIADGELVARLLPAPLPASASGSGREWLYDRIAWAWADGVAEAAETIRLRAELRAARAEIARLESAPGPARGGDTDR
jgi:hypothetical protein